MSWLSLAKNALKEAQSKIDKVLDIQGDEAEFMKDKEAMDSSVSPDKNKSISDSNTIIVKAPTGDKNLVEMGLFLENSAEAGKISNSSSTTTVISVDFQGLEVNKDHIENVLQSQYYKTNKIVDVDDKDRITIDKGMDETDLSVIGEKNDVKFPEIPKMDSVVPKMDSSMLTDFVQISDNTYKDLLEEEKTLLSEEIETTTSSSDIEIISNPNGDSSSTNSICRGGSPIILSAQNNINKGKKRHCRESSEVSIEFEYNQSDTDKLLRRISELNEILENREMRLLEVSRQNTTLMEKNTEYQILLEAKQKNREILETEEMQRLSTLEKKHQISIRERDSLREQLNSLSSKIPKDDLNKVLSEKDVMIDELRTEGEKLAKQILNLSDIIKKLRFKERENTSNLKKNKEQIESLTDEVDRLKKSLTAKDELERSQIDAVNKLSSTKTKLEKENQSLKSQIEDLTSKLTTVQHSFEAIKSELRSNQQVHFELSKKAQVAETLETEKIRNQNRNQEIMLQLEELRHRLTTTNIENSQREQKLRQEKSDLLTRLESSELRSEKLTNDISLATIPLVKQLESLQITFNNRTTAWEKQEGELLLKLKNYQDKVEKFINIEDRSKDQQNVLNSTIKSLEDRLKDTLLKSEEEKSLIQQKEFTFNIELSLYKKKIYEYEQQLKESTELIDEFRKKNDDFNKNKISIETVTNSPDSNTLEPLGVEDQHHAILHHDNRSPSISFEHNSLSESLHSAGWQQMDDLEVISNSGRRDAGLIFLNMGQSAAMYENLQSSLKQKDGEVSHLQWEVSRMQTERNFLNNEISNLTSELMEIKDQLNNNSQIESELSELKNQYDALLQMYGEKVEETQELELDLQDIKDMYKSQIDELLNQKNKATT